MEDNFEEISSDSERDFESVVVDGRGSSAIQAVSISRVRGCLGAMEIHQGI